MENFDVVHISEYLLLINLMVSLDKDSPLPDVDMEFSTSFCRDIILGCEEWKFQLRDFPQPLLEIKQIYLFGKLGVAEQVAPKRGKGCICLKKYLFNFINYLNQWRIMYWFI